MHYLGIDIGTTNIKLCVIDDNAEIIALEVIRQERQYCQKYGSYFDPELLWAEVKKAVRTIVAGNPLLNIASIGIASMAEAGLPIDCDGNAIFPIIPWDDKGAAHYHAEISRYIKGYELYKKTGLIWHPKYTLNRILWLKKEYPEVHEKTDCCLSVGDYIQYRLTGQKMTHNSLAVRTMMMDVNHKKWDENLLYISGMKGKMPHIMQENTNLPNVSHDIADELGISKKTRVMCCGHDHLCAAVAENIVSGDKVMNSMGTSEVYFGFMNELHLNKKCYEAGVCQGSFGNLYYWMSNMPSSGASVEWLRSTVGYVQPSENCKKPSDVMYLPFVNGAGTHRTHAPEGTMLNLGLDIQKEDIVQGTIEGIAMESKAILDGLENTGLLKKEKIISAGGSINNSALMQAKADITGREFYPSQKEQSTAVGAAIMAARKTGADIRAEDRLGLAFEPNEKLKDEYKTKYDKYVSYIKKLSE